MERQELALALADIHTYQSIISEAETAFEQFSYSEPYSQELVITSAEIQEARRFEGRKEAARLHIEQHKERMTKSISQLLAALPKVIVKEMRDEGKAIFASWVTDDIPEGRHYGPYAAYFDGKELKVEQFSNLENFKTQFELRRDQEANTSSDDDDL